MTPPSSARHDGQPGDYTLWVPSLGSTCGIAEYTTHLGEALSGVRMTREFPDVARLRVVHVQHEYALFDDRELSRQVRELRESRIPVVVTEHSVIIAERPVGPVKHPWERVFFTAKHDWESQADVLVSLNARGYEVLRARWPGKRIVYLPHGCPTYFPPRKTKRGLVIGAFGFLAPYKGFWHLLKVLREVAGTELLIYSHPKFAGYEAAWARAAAGLPVRWVKEYLSEAEIAAQLAANADVLVFWYGKGPFASASGAVRVGLASGVPVLTSPIGTFSDLTEVTYQPTDLVSGVRRLLGDGSLQAELTSSARDYCFDNSWSKSGVRHLELWREMEDSSRR